MLKDLFDRDISSSTDASYVEIDAAKSDLENLLKKRPPQVQIVWDNLNVSLKHRYERKGDDYAQTHMDWMASLWIKDRIDVSHLEDKEGLSVLNVADLKISDMLPTEPEKGYIFKSLVAYYSSRLVNRHPNVFKSINQCIKPNQPHQFQDEMNRESSEYTGELFTKSESKTEDLLSMMSKVQESVHTFLDDDGIKHCHERKIVSGDNKTEKNMHHGIIRLTHFYSFEPYILYYVMTINPYYTQLPDLFFKLRVGASRSSHVGRSVGRSVGPSVGRSVGPWKILTIFDIKVS